MAASASTARRSRRTKIATTVGALALVGAAGGYGTFAAFTDTTALNGSASAGTVQLNDSGADSRTVTVANLLPGDVTSACFVVAAPTAGNTQAIGVSLAATDTTTATTANTALAGSLTVGLDRVAATGADFLTTDGASGTTRTLTRGDTCTTPTFPAGAGTTSIAAVPVTGVGSLADTFTLASGASAVYRVTLTLPAGAPQAAQGGAASFRLTWTGSAGAV